MTMCQLMGFKLLCSPYVKTPLMSHAEALHHVFSGPDAESIGSECVGRVDAIIQYRRMLNPANSVGEVF